MALLGVARHVQHGRGGCNGRTGHALPAPFLMLILSASASKCFFFQRLRLQQRYSCFGLLPAMHDHSFAALRLLHRSLCVCAIATRSSLLAYPASAGQTCPTWCATLACSVWTSCCALPSIRHAFPLLFHPPRHGHE
eukprot:354869-Chlamydomonas_euryale.AAC.11